MTGSRWSKGRLLAVFSASLMTFQGAYAAYTRATSAPVTVTQVYANEYGSPFVYFSSTVNSACSGGNALYLYDVTQTQPNWDHRRNKMALLVAAQLGGKQIILDYYYDPTVVGWSACFIEGIQVVD